ncbi:MAG: hypothetical protein PHQ85_01400 [Eubacteriales bacterium]|jgi:hypothetical protein|nr:hypothetical protein [Eubacteriales bacterium]NLO15305.1 hypothetical protein [Clostridiales bacterium]
MKKSAAYPLIALLIILLAVSGILLIERQGDRNQLSQKEALLGETATKLEVAEKNIAKLKTEIEDILMEKEQWESDKLRVGSSIARVKTVLIDSLADLDKVTQAIGVPEDIAPRATEEPLATKTPAPTSAPATTAPQATPRVTPTATPRVTQAATTARPTRTPTLAPSPTAAPSPTIAK